VLKTAQHSRDQGPVETGELMLFVGTDFVVSVRHGPDPGLSDVRSDLEARPEILQVGPPAVLYAVMDRIVDDLCEVVETVQEEVEDTESRVFAPGREPPTEQIYQLTREVIDFQRATQPLPAMLTALSAGFAKYGVDEELQRYLRDVADHVIQINERIDGFRALLRDILTVNTTLVAQQQNEEMKILSEVSNAQNEEVKKISAWAAILFAPTLIGTVYGMNFDSMPELHWQLGYPFAVLLMAMVSVTLYVIFKRRDWI